MKLHFGSPTVSEARQIIRNIAVGVENTMFASKLKG
jgi:hypothetical protein